jgi:hypothetical protein
MSINLRFIPGCLHPFRYLTESVISCSHSYCFLGVISTVFIFCYVLFTLSYVSYKYHNLINFQSKDYHSDLKRKETRQEDNVISY